MTNDEINQIGSRESVQAMLSADKFRAWLKGDKPEGYTMRRGDAEWCPLACYLADQGLNTTVEAACVTVYGDVNRPVTLKPPAWVSSFVSRVDQGATHNVRRDEALQILDLIAPARELVPADDVAPGHESESAS